MSDHDLLLQNAETLKVVYWQACTGLVGIGAILVLKVIIYFRFLRYLQQAQELQLDERDRREEAVAREKRADEMLGEVREWFKLMKGWAESGRMQFIDAAAKYQAAVTQDASQPTRADVMEAVEQLPDKTAKKVVEKVTEVVNLSDSGVRRS
jgi:hypothetical protein